MPTVKRLLQAKSNLVDVTIREHLQTPSIVTPQEVWEYYSRTNTDTGSIRDQILAEIAIAKNEIINTDNTGGSISDNGSIQNIKIIT